MQAFPFLVAPIVVEKNKTEAGNEKYVKTFTVYFNINQP